MYLGAISLCNLYDFEVSISSYGEALKVRSMSSEWILQRHVADLVKRDQWGYTMAWQDLALALPWWLLST